MALNECGVIISEKWLRSAEMRPRVLLGAFVTMPNHLHGLVTMKSVGPKVSVPVAKGARSAPLHRQADSLSSFIAGFKAATTRRLNELHGTTGVTIWQRNYHERVVRNSSEWERKRRYILENPMNWPQDDENPDLKKYRHLE